MKLDKAPRPDGLLALFFQHFWGAVKDDVIRAIMSFLIEALH